MENKTPEKTTEASPESAKKGIPVARVDQYLRFILFLVAIGLVYIWNAHRAERKLRYSIDLEEEVRELKADYSTLSSELSYSTRRSVLESRVDSIGLQRMQTSPYILH